MFLTEKDNLIALSTGKHTTRNIKLTQPALLSFSNKKHRQCGAFPAEKARFTGYHQGFCRRPQGVPYFSRCARAPPLVSGGRASLRSHEPAGFLILRQKTPPKRCLLLVELKAAKTHTVLYQINKTEYYCQVDLPLSDYPLYGKQLVASRG